MKKWILARYLIDAKKCVDSLMFLSKHVKELSNLNLREFTNDKLTKFYINLRTVYCDCFSGKSRKEMYKVDPIFERTMYEADKNYAHKDPEYDFRELESWNSLIDEIKERVVHCRELCKEHLPECLTLDFVEHDPLLFRYLHGIDKAREEEILNMLHPGRTKKTDTAGGRTMKVLQDVEQLKCIEDTSEYASIISVGLTQRETTQNLQDGFITTNALCGTDIWPSPNPDGEKEMKEILESIGMGWLY